ncbi:MAG: Holliday junction branch migration protein RuvA [Acidithiobacillus sp.]|nr:Holliday junction branch migration protein RuvA [Acidithiobacillus sp.]
MIGSLQGRILQRRPPWLWLEVAGVGYELEMPLSSFYDLPLEGQSLLVYTHFVVREDAQLLYGFRREEERDLFRLLIKVNGIGGKVALACLSGMDASQLRQALLDGDRRRLTAIPGIGAKTAERMVVELRDKLGAVPCQVANPDPSSDLRQQAVFALMSLGYKASEAQQAVQLVATELSLEQTIRQALQSLAR